LGSVMTLGEIPFHYVKDQYGDQVALPCTERNLTQSKTQAAVARGLMPVMSVKGRDEVRLGSFQSLAGGLILGPWAGLPMPKPKPEPERVSAPASDDSSSDDSSASDDAGGEAMDDDLAALLAGFDDDSGGGDDDASSDSTDEEEMDPELAALLAGL
jgi:pilus assembly protein FimV